MDVNTGDIAKLEIVSGSDGLQAQAYGSCTPALCDLGAVTLNLFGHDAGDKDPSWGMATFISGFDEITLIMHRDGNQLVLEVYTLFKDDSDRSNYRLLSLMKR